MHLEKKIILIKNKPIFNNNKIIYKIIIKWNYNNNNKYVKKHIN